MTSFAKFTKILYCENFQVHGNPLLSRVHRYVLRGWSGQPDELSHFGLEDTNFLVKVAVFCGLEK